MHDSRWRNTGSVDQSPRSIKEHHRKSPPAWQWATENRLMYNYEPDPLSYRKEWFLPLWRSILGAYFVPLSNRSTAYAGICIIPQPSCRSNIVRSINSQLVVSDRVLEKRINIGASVVTHDMQSPIRLELGIFQVPRNEKKHSNTRQPFWPFPSNQILGSGIQQIHETLAVALVLSNIRKEFVALSQQRRDWVLSGSMLLLSRSVCGTEFELIQGSRSRTTMLPLGRGKLHVYNISYNRLLLLWLYTILGSIRRHVRRKQTLSNVISSYYTISVYRSVPSIIVSLLLQPSRR